MLIIQRPKFYYCNAPGESLCTLHTKKHSAHLDRYSLHNGEGRGHKGSRKGHLNDGAIFGDEISRKKRRRRREGKVDMKKTFTNALENRLLIALGLLGVVEEEEEGKKKKERWRRGGIKCGFSIAQQQCIGT